MKEQEKLSFEIKMQPGPNNTIKKHIYIDGELLDWSVDVTSLMDAYKMGPYIFQAAKKDIEKHFVESVSDVVGRKVTAQEIKQAGIQGWI